jgi:Arc/MetJ family transcription regulator
MKTTLDIPSDLLEEAMRASGARTKRAAVLTALGDLARRGRMRDLADRMGDSPTFMTPAQLDSLRVRETPE